MNLKFVLILFLLLLSRVFICAQNLEDYSANPYEKEWEAYEKYKENSNTTKALKILHAIEKSIKKNQKILAKDAFLLKIEIEKILVGKDYRYANAIAIINVLEQKIDEKQGISKNILSSILANAHVNYISNNFQKISEINEVDASVNLLDKSLWDLKRWYNSFEKYQNLSLQGNEIRTTDSKLYMPLFYLPTFNQDKYSYEVQPTLYDILISEAIFLSITLDKLNRNYSNKNILHNEKTLAPLDSFLSIDFQQEQMPNKVLSLYQNHLIFNKEKNNILALMHADLSRLEYAIQSSKLHNKNILYHSALETWKEKYKDNAKLYYFDYYTIINADIHGQNNRTNILKKIDSFLTNPNHPEVLLNSVNNFKAHILEQDFRTKIELELPVNKPILIQVDYLNLDKLYYKVIRKTNEIEQEIAKENYHYNDERIFEFYNKQSIVKQGVCSLANNYDNQKHSTEVYIDGLESGIYIILLSIDESFDINNNTLTMHKIIISDLNYIENCHSKSCEYNNGYIVHRVTGEPLENIKIDILYYDNNKETYIKIKHLYTDKKGHFSLNDLTLEQLDKKINLLFTNGKDTLSQTYRKNHDSREDVYIDGVLYMLGASTALSREYMHILVDRAIYRPGQKVNFKGILYNNTNNVYKIIPNRKTIIYLKDNNDNIVDSISVKSNNFGSFSGTFNIPMDISLVKNEVNSHDTSDKIYYTIGDTKFRVEEYKLPKFNAELFPISDAYRLNDTIKIKGKAMSFAGNALSNATVNYKVSTPIINSDLNNLKINYEYRYSTNPFITTGQTSIDKEGYFEFSFVDNVEPKYLNSKYKYYYFHYTIYADIVDITGEIYTDSIQLVLTSYALNVELNIDKILYNNKAQTLNIISDNFNGRDIASIGKIQVQRLENIPPAYAKRLWDFPTLKSIPEADFKKLFPQFSYEKEINFDALETTLIWEVDYNTALSKNIDLPTDKWSSGLYNIILTTEDKYGKTITIKKQIEIRDSISTIVPLYEKLYTTQTSYTVYGDTTIYFNIGAPKEAYILVVGEYNGQLLMHEWIKTDKLHTIPFYVKEEYKNKVEFSFFTFYDNRFYKAYIDIHIPYIDRDLEIELLTFRDKLSPQEKEEWKVKVSNRKGEKVVAELLASMYDTSLDVFAQNTWALPKPNPNYFYWNLQSLNYKSWCYNHYTVNQSSIYLFQTNKLYDYYKLYDSRNSSYLKSRGFAGFEKRGERTYMDLRDRSNSMPLHEYSNIYATNKSTLSIRKNPQETLFFFPHIKSNNKGEFEFSFTTNEALTTWKLMLLAHTKDLAWGYTEKEIITQKKLMVQANESVFLRQGDTLFFSAKISNFSNENIEGEVVLQLFNAKTKKSIHKIFVNDNSEKKFSIAAQNTSIVSWQIILPKDFSEELVYKLLAKSGNFSDGEENILSVISN